jgi:hypothetical protein
MAKSVCGLQHEWLNKDKQYREALAHHGASEILDEALTGESLSEEALRELIRLQDDAENARQAYVNAMRDG